MSKIVVIGGGASGMCAALAARESGAEVILFEHNDRLGKKLNATGNGKCNLGNEILQEGCYRGGDMAFVDSVFDKCSPADTREWLSEHGLMIKNKRGYFYPHSEQAASVVSFFASKLLDSGVGIHCSSEVLKVKKEKKGFSVQYKDLVKDSMENMSCDRVILASGGMAGQNLGAGPFGYETAKSFGHIITPLFPALVQLVAKDKNLKTLSGVRTEAGVHLITQLDGREQYYSESGEILFTDYGISGIAVMQLSRFAGDVLRQKGTAKLSLDFMVDYSFPELQDYLLRRKVSCGLLSVEDCLCGMLPKKLMYVILLRTGIAPDSRYCDLGKDTLVRICRGIKEFSLPIMQTKDFSMAQVTAGGVALSGINPKTMESKLQKGLYLTGELLDVDGTCGGYNLQFAFATGILAGLAASKRRERSSDD